jgi:hypothetical protein
LHNSARNNKDILQSLRSEDSEATLSRGICIYYYESSMIAIGTSGLLRKCFRLLVDMQGTSQEVL